MRGRIVLAGAVALAVVISGCGDYKPLRPAPLKHGPAATMTEAEANAQGYLLNESEWAKRKRVDRIEADESAGWMVVARVDLPMDGGGSRRWCLYQREGETFVARESSRVGVPGGGSSKFCRMVNYKPTHFLQPSGEWREAEKGER